MPYVNLATATIFWKKSQKRWRMPHKKIGKLSPFALRTFPQREETKTKHGKKERK